MKHVHKATSHSTTSPGSLTSPNSAISTNISNCSINMGLLTKYFALNDASSYITEDNCAQFSALIHTKTSTGVDLHITAHQSISKPIVLLHTTATTQNNIFLAPNTNANIIEIFLNADDSDCFVNTTTDIVLAENSTLTYSVLQHNLTANAATSNVNVQINQQANSSLKMFTTASGGSSNRIVTTINLLGSNATCNFSAIECPKLQQTHDIHLNIEHLIGNCGSETCVRGIVTDKAHAAFTGKITVHPNASQSKANLQHKHLLLSPNAEVDSRPQLEIYNDDVQCAHGSSIGQLDPEAIFYMQSRGIPMETARQLLITGFLAPIIAAIPSQIQHYVRSITDSITDSIIELQPGG